MTFDRSKGVYRLNIDLPIELWELLTERAARDGKKPSHVIKEWLTERALAEQPPALPPAGTDR